MLEQIFKEIEKLKDPERAKHSLRYFKTGPGEYGAGDKFLGLNNPQMRALAKKYKNLDIGDIATLLKSGFHEERQIALFILVHQFEGGDADVKTRIYNFYLKNTKYINNWDLVDLSAHKIVGAYLVDKEKLILYKLVKSKDLWEKRIAVISTFWFIINDSFEDALKIAEILLEDKHDLIHKAVGWMLREIGK
ncbi:MAG: DNA alkylation repair protein, partial [Candidatus ainarchaeum sp.]|nr:DNA alkylation repair protein [Candidatus ainarchaeum sp.]